MDYMAMGYGCEFSIVSAMGRADVYLFACQSDDMLHSLSRLLLPRRERVPLECQTRSLDIISKKNIGEGARLIN